MDEELADRLRAAAHQAFGDEPVVLAYLFGSRAAGGATARSDTDIAVLLDDALDADQRFAFALRSFRPLDRAAPGKVDLVVLNDAPLLLRGRILRHRRVLYSRDETVRADYESLTLRRYWDFAPRAEAMSRAYLAATARGET